MGHGSLGLEERFLLATICCLLATPFILTAVLLATLEDNPNGSYSRSTDWPIEVVERFGREYPVIWAAPFFSHSGYGTEAHSFVFGLEKLIPGRIQIRHFGDDYMESFVNELPSDVREQLRSMQRRHTSASQPVISICHSVPPSWSPNTRCPSANAAIKIGRTMFETDSVPSHWVPKLNAMDQIWVPTEFHVETFKKAGVDEKKLFAIPEAVDTDYFDPNCYLKNYNFGNKTYDYTFLSVFKWEERKGWKILIESFLEEFVKKDNVLLYVLSRARGKENPSREIAQIMEFYRFAGYSDLPDIIIHTGHMHVDKIPNLYRSVDAFVLPSKGEGWGRPQVEAMAMELPSISTFWSGPTEFMTPENSYPLNYSRFEGVDKSLGPNTKGHKWVSPSKVHLRQLMRHLYENPEEGRQKGKQARLDLIRKYSVQAVANLVHERLATSVKAFVASRVQKKEEETITQQEKNK